MYFIYIKYNTINITKFSRAYLCLSLINIYDKYAGNTCAIINAIKYVFSKVYLFNKYNINIENNIKDNIDI